MSDASASTSARDPAHFQRGDGSDRIFAALAHLERILSECGGSPRTASFARQTQSLEEWARGLGLLLEGDAIIPNFVRGGQEHDIWKRDDRIWKLTRSGVFGFSPGIELDLVSAKDTKRRFHLWEATPFEYLERMQIQNELVPGLNTFEGVVSQANGDIAIVISQPTFDIIPVTEVEIDEWFAGFGFTKITSSGYYREADNLGIFDAHDKNVVRSGAILIPFDVVPCHPSAGFLEFIHETLEKGEALKSVRSTRTGEGGGL